MEDHGKDVAPPKQAGPVAWLRWLLGQPRSHLPPEVLTRLKDLLSYLDQLASPGHVHHLDSCVRVMEQFVVAAELLETNTPEEVTAARASTEAAREVHAMLQSMGSDESNPVLQRARALEILAADGLWVHPLRGEDGEVWLTRLEPQDPNQLAQVIRERHIARQHENAR